MKSEAKGHPRSGGNRLFAPSITFDCKRHSIRAVIRVQCSRKWSPGRVGSLTLTSRFHLSGDTTYCHSTKTIVKFNSVAKKPTDLFHRLWLIPMSEGLFRAGIVLVNDGNVERGIRQDGDLPTAAVP